MELSRDMQQQAKALADPSRFALFEYIASATHPVGVAELTELLGFNHNAIRQHLAVLVESGLVAEGNEERKVRGRPRKEYALRDDALSAFGSVSGSYQRLADLLLEIAVSSDSPYEVGRRAGAAEAFEQKDTLASTVESLARQLAGDGFEPIADDDKVTLANCPFADTAAKAPGVICELHRGLIDGYLSGQTPAITHDLFLRPPHSAGCRVELVAKKIA